MLKQAKEFEIFAAILMSLNENFIWIRKELRNRNEQIY